MATLSKLHPRAVATAAAFWGLTVGTGLLGLESYKGRPGEAGEPSRLWPSASVLPRDPDRPNLVLLLHPRCPCSRASLAELARIVARSGGRAAVHVLFVKPEGTADGWERTRLWREASAMPGVRVSCDRAGREAGRFGALTSGQVVLYDAAGRLLYRGGITPARGHEGENPGARAVSSLLLGAAPGQHRNPVFGCPLFEPGRRGGEGR